MFNFESYDKKSAGSRAMSNEPVVTLLKHGTILLNKAAFEALGSPTRVNLLFDREQRVVGLANATDDASAYRLTKVSSSYNWTCRAGGFFKHFGIWPAQTQRYPATVHDGVLAVDLKNPLDEGERKTDTEEE